MIEVEQFLADATVICDDRDLKNSEFVSNNPPLDANVAAFWITVSRNNCKIAIMSNGITVLEFDADITTSSNNNTFSSFCTDLKGNVVE